jgi:hypothetical protein
MRREKKRGDGSHTHFTDFIHDQLTGKREKETYEE